MAARRASRLIGKTIQPETGKLLAWNNLLPDGTPQSGDAAPGDEGAQAAPNMC
jgi:hypothetical protein